MLDYTLVARFLGRFNFMIVSICTISRLHLEEFHVNIYFQFATGTKSFEDESDVSKNIRRGACKYY
jgi:hypothetical protein